MVPQVETDGGPTTRVEGGASPEPPSSSWVLLHYRIPREPSTPRIAVWRRLQDLGVVQLGDGLVALPASAQTQEQLEWVAAQATDARGEAIVWVATPTSRRDGEALRSQLLKARDAEYTALLAEVEEAEHPVDPRTLARWRRTWRRVDARDHTGAPHKDAARLAVADAAEQRVRRSSD